MNLGLFLIHANSVRIDPRESDKKLLCRNHFPAHGRQLICPTGGVREFLSSPPAKNILLPFFRNTW